MNKKLYKRPLSTTFGYWLRVAQFTDFKIGKFSRPEFVGKQPTPKNLNDLTLGDLITLSGVGDSAASIYVITETIMHLGAAETDAARAVDVVRFVGWVYGEVEKINALFESTNIPPTEKERRAGIDRLKFGLFGMVDWYAQRMGIPDHEEVMKVPWMRVYKCIQMDNERRLYERRYEDMITQEIKRHK